MPQESMLNPASMAPVNTPALMARLNTPIMVPWPKWVRPSSAAQAPSTGQSTASPKPRNR